MLCRRRGERRLRSGQLLLHALLRCCGRSGERRLSSGQLLLHLLLRRGRRRGKLLTQCSLPLMRRSESLRQMILKRSLQLRPRLLRLLHSLCSLRHRHTRLRPRRRRSGERVLRCSAHNLRQDLCQVCWRHCSRPRAARTRETFELAHAALHRRSASQSPAYGRQTAFPCRSWSWRYGYLARAVKRTCRMPCACHILLHFHPRASLRVL